MTTFYKNNIKFLGFIFVLFMLLGVKKSWGQAILTFDFAGLVGNEASANSNFNNTNLTSSTISRGGGLTAANNTDRFNATNWAITSIANAVSGNNYMEFTITPNSGFQFSVSSIVIQLQRSGTGHTAIALRNSVSSYSTNLDGEKSVVDNTNTQSFTFTFTQSNSSTSVTYRLYGYAEATGGSGGPGDGSGNDIVVNGIVSAISSCTPPTTQATASAATSIATTSATLNWTRGNGNNVLVVVRPNATSNALPTNGTSYTQNANYGSGATTGTNNFSVFTGTGTSVNVSGLTANTLYTQQVYEYNNTGICYLTTPATGQNFNSLHNAPNIGSGSGATGTTFTANWTAPSGGGGASFTYEIQVNDDNTFTNANEFTQSGIVSGTLSANATGLTPSTTYYYRVRAVNAGGNSAWSAVSAGIATTNAASLPTLTTPTATAIAPTSATLGANVTSDGGATITARGTVWSTSPIPTTNASSIGGTTGVFTDNRTGFSPNTLYYYRGYATNSVGTAYSPESSFTTLAISSPTVTTPTATAITATTATLGANVTSDGGAAITARGTVWGTSPNPTGNIVNTAGTTGIFTEPRSGFSPNTLYYYRGFATNSQGTSYSPDGTFTTPAAAVSIWTNPITGTNPGLTTPYIAGQTVNANISVSGILRGSGVTGANANDRYNASGWSSGALDANDYFEFTIVPNAGYKIDFTSFQYTSQLSSGTAQHTFKSSVDNFSASIGAPSSNGTTINLGAPSYQNITSAITFRFYTHNLTGLNYSINDFTFNGLVSVNCTPPTVAPNTPTSSAITPNSGTIGWTRGNGSNVAVVLRQGAAISTNPTSGVSYTPNAAFGSGASIGSGSVVYTGAGTNVNVTNLLSSTTYHYAIYEYSNTNICYNQSPLIGSFTTSACVAPTTQASAFTSSVLGTSSLKIDWTRGNGDNVIVLARAGATVNATPQSGNNSYTDNSTFGSGSQIGAGNFVVYKGTGSSVNITGLAANTTYYFAVYEYSNTNTCYNTTELLGFETTEASGQVGTFLRPGDMVIAGYDPLTTLAGISGDDYFVMLTMVDLLPGTQFIIANAPFETGLAANVSSGEFGESCTGCQLSHFNLTVGGTTIPKGSVISLVAPNAAAAQPTQFKINDISTSNINGTYYGDPTLGRMNISSSAADQVFLMQGNFTNNASASVVSSTFNGRVLYGINNGASWIPFSTATTSAARNKSRLPKDILCFNLDVTGSFVQAKQHNVGNVGVLINATQRNLIINISNQSNWANKGTGGGNDLDFTSVFSPNNGYTVTGSSFQPGRWIGDFNNDWFNCSNWENLSVPDNTTDVDFDANSLVRSDIRSTATNAPVFNNLATCKNLSISNREVNLEGSANNKLFVNGNIIINGTGTLDMSDGTNGTPDGQITIAGSWLNQRAESEFKEGEGKITFTSNQSQGIINSTSDNETFYDVEINNTGTEFALNSNLATGRNLVINTGNINAINKTVKIGGDFTNNGTLTATGSTFEFNGTGIQNINGTFQNTFNNMVVSNPSSGGVILGQNQNLTNKLSLTGTSSKLTTTGRQFTFLSDANATARLAQVNGTSTIVGNITMQRYVPGNDNVRLINYQLASPVRGAAVSQWQPSGNTPPTAPTNGFYISGSFTGKDVPASTGIIAASLASLLTYNTTGAGFDQFPLAANTEALSVGRGYRGVIRDGTAANGFASVVAKTLALTGPPHIGNFSFSLAFGGSNTLTSWNFVGNPYPCEIFGDLTNATHYPTRTNVNPAVYVFNSVMGGYNSYVSGVGVLAGGGAWDGKIPSSQGFWVRANAANPALTVSENAKTEGRSASWRIEKPQFYRVMLNNSFGADEVVVRLSDQASYGFDGEMDAQKLNSPLSNGAPSINFTSKEALKLTINSIPTEAIQPFDTVWINYSSGQRNANNFTFYGFENFDPNVEVYLIDKAKNEISDMKKINDYSFDNITYAGNRFGIVHKTTQRVEEVTATKNNQKEGVLITLQPNPCQNHQFQLQSNVAIETNQIKIYNIVGTQIPFDVANIGANKYQINLSNATKGILVVKITTAEAIIIKKVIAE